jgi:hypothetical protein
MGDGGQNSSTSHGWWKRSEKDMEGVGEVKRDEDELEY